MLTASPNSTTQFRDTENMTVGKFSTPKLMLHLEGLLLLGASVAFYANLDFAWSTFWLLLLAPDLSFIPYAMHRNVGTFVYNALHTITLPLTLITFALVTDWSLGTQLALIWLAHIGMDRAIGYGLKYTDSFKNTHLSKV